MTSVTLLSFAFFWLISRQEQNENNKKNILLFNVFISTLIIFFIGFTGNVKIWGSDGYTVSKTTRMESGRIVIYDY